MNKINEFILNQILVAHEASLIFKYLERKIIIINIFKDDEISE